MATQTTIQEYINRAADELDQAMNDKKAADTSIKELKKALKKTLNEITEYNELEKREREIKKARRELMEELREIKKEKEQIAIETDEWKELDDFREDQEEKFTKIKERVITKLSRHIADEGIIAEIAYKSKQLMLIVSRN